MAYIVPKGSFAGREWRFPIETDMAMNVGLLDEGADFSALPPVTFFQGVIHRPGGHGYFKTGKQGAMVEIPALPKAGFFTRDEVAGWLKVMDEMEAQHSTSLEELKGRYAKYKADQANRQEVKGPKTIGAQVMSESLASLDAWILKTYGGDESKPDISTEETLELTLPNCSANPQCGEDDVICPQCKAGNCPGVKCWRGCGL